jgi:magnesium chelatase family protein
MALGILAASGQLEPSALERTVILGELALDGSVRPIPGVLPVAIASRRAGDATLIVPSANAREAAAVEGLRVVGIDTLVQAVDWLTGRINLATAAPAVPASPPGLGIDFADVKGQPFAKRALEIAAAGSHHVLLIGPPDSGKSMLAQRLPTILPDLLPEEALDVGIIHSVVGAMAPGAGLPRQRPFRSPHHTTSAIALIGGGPTPRPSEVSLAHHGVLFLDELPEFHRDVLESLRQPLEDGIVSVVRARRSTTFPARFLLAAAMNPCSSVAQLSVSLS